MKLALYLPNFRTKVTLKELEDLTSLAEDLDFDSVWMLDRIVVPEASDRTELQYSFGIMAGLPKALPVASRGEWFQGMPLIPWLAAKTTKVRIGMSITDTPFRAPGVLAPGQRDRPYPRVLDDLLDGARGHEERLERALGEARPAQDVFDRQRALRHVRRVLEQPDVARHQRGRGEAEHLPVREVPRHDRQHRAERLVAGEHP